jgi:hypothetical protein
VSPERAEVNTLHAGVYLSQACNNGLISQVQFEQLTRQASECLRDWVPKLEPRGNGQASPDNRLRIRPFC